MWESTGWQNQWQSAAKVTLLLLATLVACNRNGIHRVVVAYPESWPSGEYRNCYLGGSDPEHPGLPMFDCDVHGHETPRSRMFVMDVKFSGDYTGKVDQAWTCQNGGAELVCRR
jgi:hypothetical protein